MKVITTKAAVGLHITIVTNVFTCHKVDSNAASKAMYPVLLFLNPQAGENLPYPP